MTQIHAEAGKWYEDIDEGTLFMVTSVDDYAMVAKVSYLDGQFAEMNLGAWRLHRVEKIEEPEEEPGSDPALFDVAELGDDGNADETLTADDWGGSLDEIDLED